MGTSLHRLYSLFASVILFSCIITCAIAQGGRTIATWSGDPNGAGSDSGSCGYGSAVEKTPFNKFVSAGGLGIFNDGDGCGACYEVQCLSNPSCSGKSIIVTVSDFCPTNCSGYGFDMSGTAFGAMALPGKEDQLRNALQTQIQYQRVYCNYPGFKVVFEVDSNSSRFDFGVNIDLDKGAGDISKVELKQGNSNFFGPMVLAYGSTWKLNSPTPLQAPFSIRITVVYGGKTLVANNAIPLGWKPGQRFTALVHF